MQKPQIINTREIHKGWLTLRQDSLKVPGRKSPYNYDIIRIGNGVGVLPFIDSETVLLARQYRHPVQETLLELIQGGIKKNETPEQAALRELKEETGYAGKIEPLKTIYLMPGSLEMSFHIFRATEIRKISTPKIDPLEHMELVEYDFPQLLDEILSGKHKDSALNITVLYHALNPKY